ncbi:hypothetical protein [Streptomyces cinereoruber]|uniref:hypothetical protein n=1 Tax=Streptomyces cinereoruber TaxID=67260 RepID=UPI003645BA32
MRVDRKLWKRTAVAAVCTTVAFGAAACSGDGGGQADPFAGLSPSAIADKAVKTTTAVTALRTTGHQSEDGLIIEMDIHVDAKGSCRALLTRGDGGRGEILRVDGTVYGKGDEAFWGGDEENRTIGKLLDGRWAKSPYKEGSSFSGFCDLRNYLEDIEEDTVRTGLTRGEDTEVDGVPVATLTGKGDGGGTLTLHIAKDADKPYLLRVVETGGKKPGEATFGDFDKPVSVTAPPADQAVDLDEVQKALD